MSATDAQQTANALSNVGITSDDIHTIQRFLRVFDVLRQHDGAENSKYLVATILPPNSTDIVIPIW